MDLTSLSNSNNVTGDAWNTNVIYRPLQMTGETDSVITGINEILNIDFVWNKNKLIDEKERTFIERSITCEQSLSFQVIDSVTH